MIGKWRSACDRKFGLAAASAAPYVSTFFPFVICDQAASWTDLYILCTPTPFSQHIDNLPGGQVGDVSKRKVSRCRAKASAIALSSSVKYSQAMESNVAIHQMRL